jgi:hypothetical protein
MRKQRTRGKATLKTAGAKPAKKKIAGISAAEWLEFAASAVPGIDWAYSLTRSATRVEKKVFPQFIARPHKDWIIATAEHAIYLALGFAFAKTMPVDVGLAVGAFAIFIVIPGEFLLYKWHDPLFKPLSDEELAVTASWNILNVSLYWLAGMLLGAML